MVEKTSSLQLGLPTLFLTTKGSRGAGRQASRPPSESLTSLPQTLPPNTLLKMSTTSDQKLDSCIQSSLPLPMSDKIKITSNSVSL